MSTVLKRGISARAARAVVDAAIGRAEEMGIAVTAVVVDESAVVKALVRMDGCALLPVSVAQAKARTAVSIGMDTGGLYDGIAADPAMRSGLIAQPGVTLMGGGVVLRADGAPIGAIGISGGTTEQDVDIAEAARAILQRTGDRQQGQRPSDTKDK